jgi:hypothetical protein
LEDVGAGEDLPDVVGGQVDFVEELLDQCFDIGFFFHFFS